MKKLKLLLVLMVTVVAVSACNRSQKDNDTPNSSSEISTEEEDDEIEFEEIEQETADEILENCLADLKCRAIFSEYTDIDDISVYLYSVVDENNEELDQMLAVSAVSGEVMVYDTDNDRLLPYDRFKYYIDDGKSPASWDSSYYLPPRTVNLEPADDNSFEFSIIKDNKDEPELTGVAYVSQDDTHEAVYENEDENVSLTFVNKGDTLEIRDNGNISGVAGIYERQD
ncbi:MAG: hypothetical protein K6A90_07495 [Lachnospiraceae bacterium]|nr:hypothetical protein [Lachnospiraceae bacterium]